MIPNNTQVRTTVFVEKRALTEALQQAATAIEREEKNREEKNRGEKNKDKPDMVNLSAAEKATIAANLGVAEKATIANSEERSFMQPKSESPFLIRMALGKLILVGDPIEYLPRVQIESDSSQQSSTVVLSPTSLSFTKGTAEQKVTLTDAGTGALTMNSVTVTGPDKDDFKVTANTCGSTVAAGANCEISVTFTPPSTVGAQSATLNIDDSAAGLPQTVYLSGAESSVELSPNSLTFSNQPVNKASSGQKVTVTNAGTAPLTIPQNPVDGTDKGLFSLDTSKTQSDACGSTLPPQQSCGIYVIFTPTKAGSFGATLSIADDVHASPQTVSLNGTGK
ncbi:MAG: choice-of-anchor D domain-containing protein [Terriglobia bacterium]